MSHAIPTPLLVLEAATAAASVALIREGVVLAERSVPMGVSRDDTLLPAIADVLHQTQLTVATLGAIVCGSGPGSFTSLRIAAALAKGLAIAHAIPLYAVPSLLLAGAALAALPGEYWLHADALRGERFVLPIRVSETGQVAALGTVSRVPLSELTEATRYTTPPRTLVAVGGAMTQSGPSTENASGDTIVANDARWVVPHARGIIALTENWPAFGPVNVALWEPDYGRLAEAQVKWEVEHGRPLPAS